MKIEVVVEVRNDKEIIVKTKEGVQITLPLFLVSPELRAGETVWLSLDTQIPVKADPKDILNELLRVDDYEKTV